MREYPTLTSPGDVIQAEETAASGKHSSTPHIQRTFYFMVKTLDVLFNEIESHWRVLNQGVTQLRFFF